jgi:hypothetical protein
MASAHHSVARSKEMVMKYSNIDSQNYYEPAVQRVLDKLGQMGVDVPPSALEAAQRRQAIPGVERWAGDFSRIMIAVLGSFDSNDYEQAQGLIHFRPPGTGWCVATPEKHPRAGDALQHRTVFSSTAVAVANLIALCDQSGLRIDRCQRQGENIAVIAEGVTFATIKSLAIEPFDSSICNRVRTAFKGVRAHNGVAIEARAVRLPGFKQLDWSGVRSGHDNGRQLLALPGSWAVAMRGALLEVGTTVSLSQAQELVAVFFGASNWHQLVKHRDVANAAMVPIGVEWQGVNGASQIKYFWKPEEALFAIGLAAENSPHPLRVQYFNSSLSVGSSVSIALYPADVARRSNSSSDLLDVESTIQMPADDYQREDFEEGETSVTMRAARELLARMGPLNGDDEMGAGDGLYSGDGAEALFKGIMARNGIPARCVVMSRDNACGVCYQSVNDEDTLGAVLYIYTRKGEALHSKAILSVYKAEMSIAEERPGYSLIIRGDYGNDDPIVLRFDNEVQLRKLLALTHAKGLYSLVSAPTFPSGGLTM